MKVKSLLFAALALGAAGASAQSPYTYEAGNEIEANENLYKLTGENLITNGYFADGTTGWTSYGDAPLGDAFTVSSDGGPDGGRYNYLQMPASGQGITSSTALYTVYRLEAGKTYFVSYLGQVKTTYGGILLSGGSQDASEDGNYTLFREDVSEGDEWKHYSAVFTVDAAHEYMIFTFRWTNSDTRIACVNLFEAEQQVTYTRLEKAIADAEQLLADTEAGTEPGQYPADARTALLNAIEAAKGALTATTVAEVEGAVADLSAAVAAYKNTRVPYELQANVRYYVKNVWSGLFLNLNWQGDPAKQRLLLRSLPETEADADPAEVNKDFQIVFVPAPESAGVEGYNIRNANNDFIYRDSWNIFYPSTDLSSNNSIFTVESVEGGRILIKNLGSGLYLAPDNNWSWSPVYSDKEGEGNEKAYYLLEPAVPGDYNFSGVENVTMQPAVETGETVVYDLFGRRVANPSNGIYIINGKKTVVR